MLSIELIIQSLSKEQKQDFIRYLQAKNRRHDIKNIPLFKSLEQGMSSESIFEKLYKGKNRNALHALRKRLYDALIDFVANKALIEENSETMQLRKEVLAAQYLYRHKQAGAALKLLSKTEHKAKQILAYDVLNDVYLAKIQHAHLATDNQLSLFIDQYEANKNNAREEERLDLAYASIRHLLHKVTRKGKVITVDKDIPEIFEHYQVSEASILNYKTLYQLAQIVNSVASVSRTYFGIDHFLEQKYLQIEKLSKDTRAHRYYKIQVLYFLANSFFRNRKFKRAFHYLSSMREAMEEHQGKYRSVFERKYICLLALTKNYSGDSQGALEAIEPFLKNSTDTIESLLDIKLTAIVIYFQQQDWGLARKQLSGLYHTDSWLEAKVGVNWALKKNLIELLLHLELENHDLFESRFKSFHRKFKNHLIAIAEERVLTFLKLIWDYYKDPEAVRSKDFMDKVETAFDWQPREQEDLFVMSFFAWLKSKMLQQDLYKTTLELMQ